jgi:hypothetical protein
MRAATALVLLGCVARAQQPAPDPVAAAFEELMATLEPTHGEPPPLAAQLEAMLLFLEHNGKHTKHHRVLQLRLRLGTALLHGADFEGARTQFGMVLDVPQAQRDLQARALYGRAQALELLGEVSKARKDLEQLVANHAGERYGRYAKAAMQRLDALANNGARVDEQAPDLSNEPVVDLDGVGHRISAYADRPLLLVFWAPEVDASIVRLGDVLAAWERGGGQRKTVLALALTRSITGVERVRKERRLQSPFLVCSDEFVHPAALAYRVTKVPTVVVIAPGGTIVARDVPAAMVERLARALH